MILLSPVRMQCLPVGFHRCAQDVDLLVSY